jgi:carboxyl-terminal processing protease
VAKRSNQKLKVLYVLDILKKHSDEEHPLNASQIVELLEKEGIEALVIDVRGNNGGYLTTVTDIASYLLPKGSIIYQVQKDDDKEITKDKTGTYRDYPIAILVESKSESASEILAGALQDHRRAVILGEKSFGKGSVQTVIPLRDYGAMRITTARYYTPSGRSIQAKGIEPDILVKPAKVEELESYALNISEAELNNALKNDTTNDKEVKNQKKKSKEDLADYQLIRALDLVKALSLYSKPSSN